MFSFGFLLKLCKVKNFVIKMCASRICFLQHLESKKRISLPHDQPKKVGRSIETEIQDTFVSKHQIECIADTKECLVTVTPLGNNISGIDGYATVKGRNYSIGHGHRVQLRLGFHEFEVVFEPPPESQENDEIDPVAKKPKMDFPIFKVNKDIQSDKMCFTGNGTWEDVDYKELLIYTPENLESRSKIAAFDIDGTIIKTKSGKKWPTNTDDWILNISIIPEQLKQLYEDKYKIVFFTNQSGVGQDSFKIKGFKKKIENILNKIGLPIQVFIAIGKGIYRKPLPGMWNILLEKKNDGVEVDLGQSFYVGDAAGRSLSKKQKDHSLVDRLFALNIGLKFHTPEEYFLKSSVQPFNMPEFDPRQLPSGHYPEIKFDEPNVILMVGLPGSGKSHFCRKVLISKGYTYINRDTVGSWQKCVQAMDEALTKKNSCVIDNTNLDKESRKRFIEVAKKFKVDCRCFIMPMDVKHTKHNNRFREITDKSHQPVGDIIINSFKKNYQEPELSEGFKELLNIKFVPDFDSEENEKLYKMFLLEK